MNLELEAAQGVRDPFDGVGLPVGVVVHRVDAPLVAGSRMLGVQDPVHRRVSKIHVRGGHVDLGSQNPRPIGELARAHPLEQVQVFLDRSAAVRTVASGFGERAAILADLVGGEVVYVGIAGLDQVDGPLIQLLEVARRVVEVLAPVVPEPMDVSLDTVDVLLLFLGGVRVVEAQVGAAAEVARNAKVDADGLGVADVEVAVRLGREPRDDALMLAVAQVRGHDLADEIASFRGCGCLGGHALGSRLVARP